MKQSILITGCSSGIGYTCAHALKDRGFQVIASCRKQEDVERLCQEGLVAIQLDLADSSSIDLAIEKVRELTGGNLYALFNNGAYGQPGALEDLPTEALREQFEVNVFGWHHLTKAVLPMMRNAGQGRIVQNSSVLGIVAMRYRGAYNASKFAIEGWTDTLRLELNGTDIHISLIEPGPIHSRFRANALKMFKKHITLSGSPHESQYQQQLARLGKETSANRYTLPAEAIVTPLLHALESKRPRNRYRVTQPTKLMAVLKRLLSSRMMDRILVKGD
ncbi:SDR family oxidoreductase [Parasalinivibrio latis]|uniref:SDR family oxidoreductase n=1 Tax=Parasalinivibrio latis TaxID=2952610 RepID=UPI0030E1C430